MKKKHPDTIKHVLIAPALIFFVAITIFPLVFNIIMSLCSWKLGGNIRFIGLDNYISAFENDVFWRTMLNLDDAYQQNPDGSRTNLFLTGQFHGDIWGGMALSMGLMGAGKHTLTAVDYMSAKHGVNKADTKAKELLGAEIWEPMKSTIDLTTNDNIGKIADNIIKDSDFTNEEKAAVMDYMERSLYMRGFNLATMAKSRNGERNEDIQQADESYIDGYSINSPQEMNDAKNLYEYHRQQVSNIVSEETLAMIDSNPVETLARLNNGEINSSDRNAVIDYINAKLVYEGMMQRVRDDIDSRIEQSNAMVDARVNRSTGRIQGATMKLDDRKVYVISGNLVPYSDGTGIDLSASDNSIIIRDAESGTLEQVAPDAVLSIDEAQDPNEQKVLAAEAIRQQYAQGAADKIDGVITFNVGDTYTIQGEDGTQAQIQIVANENGIVDNGDGTVNVTDGSGNIVAMAKEFIQAQVDAQNKARVARFEQQRTAENQAAEQAAMEAQRPQYEINKPISLRDVDGNVVRGSIEEITPDGILVAIENPANGLWKPTMFAKEDLDSRVVGYDGVAYERPRVDSPANTETPETTETDNHDNSAGETLQGDMQGSALDRIPKDEQGQPLYEQADADTAWDAIVEQTGSEQDAQEIADSEVSDREKALKRAEGMKISGKTPAEKIAAQQQRKVAVEAARGQVEIWKKIAGTANRRKAAVEAERRRAADEAAARRRAKEERERAEREEAERIEREALNGVPDMVDDAPKDARARGYRRVNGHKIDRQEPIPVVQGKEVAVKFSDNTIPSGHVAVIDASMLQPSHIAGMRNPLHFIDEAQPKERIDDASVLSAQKIAGNIRPEEITSSITAYTGAPSVNVRGEVIQGNNRSAALKTMWAEYPEQAARYKQYLKEHATEWGLAPGAIDDMRQPVIVNVLDVDDAEAIALGQFVAQDTESGGIERIKPRNAAQRMGKDMRTFANILLRSADDEASFSQLIDSNGVETLKWMAQKGHITPTQYQSALDSRGNITAEAKNDLRGILYQSIFTSGSTQLEEMFGRLPAKAQRAILATAYRDFDNPATDRMIGEIQASVMAYNALSQDAAFSEGRNWKEASRAVEMWKRQYQLDDATGESYLPADNYSNFALHLATMYKAQSQGLMQGTFNKLYDMVQGTQEENLFEQPDNTPRTLTQAIKETLNIDYNGRHGSNVLAGGSAAGQRGRQGGDGGSQTGGRDERESRQTDNSRGTETDSGLSQRDGTPKTGNIRQPASVDEKARWASIRLNGEQCDILLAQMREQAEVAPYVELNPTTWNERFGENGIINTPIGEVKMGENQIAKFFAKGREKEFGMVAPTLSNPDMIIEKEAPALGAERDTKLLFIKTFIKTDGSRYVNFESVSVQKDGMEVSISSHEVDEKVIKKEMQNGNILHLRVGLPFSSEWYLTETPVQEGPDLVPSPDKNNVVHSVPAVGESTVTDTSEVDNGQSEGATASAGNSSEGKDSDKPSDTQTIGEKVAAEESQRERLTEKQAADFIAFMEETADVAQDLELTPKNWAAEFGEDGIVNTPIGQVKQGENQYLKLAQQGRNGKLGMVKPTLEHPSIIVEDKRPSKDGKQERDSSYVFIKTFIKEDGSRYYYFASVTVRKEDKEVVISSQERSAKRISKLLQQGKIAWIDTAFSLHPTAQVGEPVPLNDSNRPTITDSQPALLGIDSPELSRTSEETSSEGKDSDKPSDAQTIGRKVAEAEAETDTSPTDGQKEAGNYKKGHVRIGQFDITIENPKGSLRRGVDKSGKAWEQTMRNTYGYIRGTEGVDGDHIDVFLTNDIDSWNGRRVYIVDQYNEDGTFDEHKVMLGFNDEADAQDAYLSNYERGWSFKRKLVMNSANLPDFERWINSSHRKTKPFAEYKSVKAADEPNGANKPNKTVEYEITPAQYTTKRGKVLDMFLVKFAEPLSKEQQRAARELAKAEKGWHDRDKGGFMMRSKESARRLADTILGDEEAVSDAQPLSLADTRKLEEPTMRQVDIEGLMQAIRENGEARLSDHFIIGRPRLTPEQTKAESGSQKQGEKKLQGVQPVSSDQGRQDLATGSTVDIGAVVNTSPTLRNGNLAENKQNPSGNKLVTDERYEELKKRMKAKLGQLNVGIDPEILAIGTEMAVYHIEKGTRKFAEFAKSMIADLGDVVRPYLKAFYNGARDMPEVTEAGLADDMTPYEEVRTFDVANFDKGHSDIFATAKMAMQEQQTNRQADEAKEKLINQRNEQRRKEDEQTAADSAAIAGQAEAVASQAESDIETATDEKEVNDAIGKVDEQLDKVNRRLALLGYYEAEAVERDFNEAYGYMRNAEKKAVKDANSLAKRLIKDLGIDPNAIVDKKGKKRKSIATADIAPIGGDISIRLPLGEKRELYIAIQLDKQDGDNLKSRGGMLRMENPNPRRGEERYLSANNFFNDGETYQSLLGRAKNLIRHYAPEYEFPTVDAKHTEIKGKNKPKSAKSKEKTVSSHIQGALFDDVAEGRQAAAPSEAERITTAGSANTEEDETHRTFVEAVKNDMLAALDNGTKPYRSILDLRRRAASVGMEVDGEGRSDILLQELVEDGLVRAAREVVARNGNESRESFDLVCKLHEMQPTIAQRSSNRIKMQQYSTPLPMGWAAARFAMHGKRGGKVLEPTAGNGMLVFAVPASQVHANELDETRLANLRGQSFARVTRQDATEPFEGGKQYDAVIANPPFGYRPALEYDGKMIPGLDPQIALNALASMKDDGRAAIIIGGNMEYADNGAIKNMKPFFTYLYDHYNVKGVIDMSGALYAKQGTTYPTRMILIDGRRSEEERAQSAVYPPVESKALRKAESFDDLYEILNEVLNSKGKTNGTEILRERQPARPVADRPRGNTDQGGREEESSKGNRPVERLRGGLDSRLEDVLGEQVGNDTRNGRGDAGERGGNRELGGHTDQRVGMEGRPSPVPAQRGGSETRTDTVGRGGQGVHGRGKGQLDPQLHPDGNIGNGGGSVLKGNTKRQLDTEKLPYRPHNSAFSLESVAPAAMVEAMDRALAQIEEKHGNIDEFVTRELGYGTTDDLHQALAAEQIDSVAMAIYQMQQGHALIIGDQTGVGKGRQMAALIRWAVRQGKKPIFITQKADLFSDIYRDLVDIGSGDLRPFIFNKDGAMVDAKGHVVYRPLSDAKMRRVLETQMLPDGYDFAVLTYSQVNTGDKQSREEARERAKKSGKRAKGKKKDEEGKITPKAPFLRAISEDNYLLLDESHTAAGESNTGSFMQSILRSAKAATFASATFAKRPDTMPLYAIRTAMSQAKVEPDKLIGIIERGGVTLQEIMSRELTNAGQMVRRERDMSDVVTDWKTVTDPETVGRAKENYDRTIAAFNAIIKFQEDYVKPLVDAMSNELAAMAESAGIKRGTNKMGVDNVPFASKTYNYTKQLMLALKVDAIVAEVAAEINAGRHPVIALESTMESSIDDYAVGEVISEPTFSANLLKGLDAVMQYTVKDENGNDEHYKYAPSQLGPTGEKAYYELREFIRQSTSGIFISPIDAIIERLHGMGYKVGELTGRDHYVERDGEGRIVVRKRTDKDKKRMQREFNNGALDVLILNKSASTGISLHASEKFSDQRQRTMIIAQPLSDINDYMQMIGRIDRTGQVHRGYYINLGLPVPAENRFLMMLSTKLKSLNANTTTSQESESNEVEAPDLLNKYGSQVVVEYLRDNPDIYEKMGMPLKAGSGENGKAVTTDKLDEYKAQEDDAMKVTGRVALLTTDEQEEFYDDVVRRYNELIKYLDDTGSNDLKITVMPLRAKTLDRRISSEGIDPNGSNPFAQNSYVEKVEMDVLRKPMKAAEIRKVIEQVNRGMAPTAYLQQVTETIRRENDARIASEEERYRKAREKAAQDIAKQRDKINAQKKRSEEEKRAAIENFAAETNERVETRHNDNLARLRDNSERLQRRLKMFEVGRSYLVPDNMETQVFNFATPAIFCGYKAKESKITASTTLAVFATLDGRRRIEVKLSDINALLSIDKMTNDNWDAARATTLENWDSQIPSETRKTGYIMTGNILQAIADTQDEKGGYPGQLISYTDIDGNIHDGILMPDKWNTSMLRNSGTPLSARMEQIKQFVPIVSSDGKVAIRGSKWAGMYHLTVPKSKKEGGKYFDNEVILDAAKNHLFYQTRGQFTADIPSDRIEEVVKELTRLGVKVNTSSDGDVVFRDGEGIEAVNELFNGQLQQQVDGRLPAGHIYQLGRPGKVLLSTGIPEAAQRNHEFDIADVKDLPKALQSPIAVFSYGDKRKAQNVIVELERGGKKFVVGIHLNQDRRGMVVNDIRGLFPKENAEWLNWITQGKLLYANKRKIQALIAKQRTNLAEVDYLNLDSVANIVESLENPKATWNEDGIEAVNELFNGQLQQQIDGTLPKGHIYQFGQPGSILLSAGLPDLPIEMAASRLSDKSMQENHPFDLSEIRDLPRAVQNPMAVFRSATHIGSYVVMTEIEHGGKNFVVAIEANRRRGRIEVNSVRSVYPKTNRQVANWIDDGLLEYADKKRMAEWLSKQRSNSADVRKLFNHAAKIVESFENPKYGEENLREGGGSLSDDEISIANDPIAKVTGLSPRTAAQRRAFAERERLRMEERVNELVETLHLDNVDVVTSTSGLQGRKATAKGFYDRGTGRITIVIPNHTSALDAEQTLLHEAVAHYGLRRLFGKHFDTFLYNVFKNADVDVRRRIVELSKKHGWEVRTATEEYLASLAERTDFENTATTWWQRIKRMFCEMLRRIGFEGFNEMTLSDNELRYVLWASYRNLKGELKDIFGVAADIAKQQELRVGNYAATTQTDSQVAETSMHVDRQGNPIYADGSLILEKVISVEDITDEDFINPSRNIELPPLAENVEFMLGTQGKPIVIKKNIFKKNNTAHPEISPAESRRILKAALYSPTMLGQTQPVNRPHYWVAVQTSDKNSVVVLEVNATKSNVEIVGWRRIDTKGLDKMKRQAEREGGQFLILTSTDAAAALSALPPILPYGKDSKKTGNLQGEEKALDWIEALRNHRGTELTSQELASATKVVENFKNSKASDENNGGEVLYREGDPEEHRRVLARERYEGRVARGMYQAQEALQDSMLSVKEAMDAIMRGEGKKGVYVEEIAGFENAYLGENRLSSVNKAEADAFGRLLFKPLLDEVASLAPTKAAQEELTDYMMAKHGLERNRVMAERDAKAEYEKRQKEHPDSKKTLQDFIDKFRERDYAGLTALTGIEDVAEAEAEARRMVADYESAHDTAVLWRRMKAVSGAILSKLHETGMMSRKTYDQLRQMYEYYIPLRGFDEKTSAEAYAYLDSKDSAFTAPIKTAKGRKSKADDPLAYLQSMVENAIMQGNRNKLVKQRFLNFVLNHPSDLASVSELWVKYDEAADEWVPVLPEGIEKEDTAEAVERKMRDFEDRMERLAEAEPNKYKRGRDAVGIPYRVVTSRDLHQHQVVVKRSGKDYVITINGNPRAAQALNGLTNPDNDIQGKLGNLLNQTAGRLNRELSAFYTTRNPDFVLSNTLRDMLYANTMVWLKENPNYARRFHRNFARVNHARMVALFDKLRRNALDMNDPVETMFQQFIMNGGETGYTDIRDIERRKNEIRRELKMANGKLPLRKAWGMLGERLDEVNRGVENCARFAAFVTSREMGRSIDRAIYDAKEISVNFNKKGAGAKFRGEHGQTKLGNVVGVVSGFGRFVYVFWNAAIQGTANFGRQARWHPAKALTGLASMFILGAVIAALGGDDDDDKNAYYNLPEYVRRSNIMFRVGDQWISIPLPVEYRAVYGLGELMTSTLSGKEHLTDEELADQIMAQVSQLLPLDLMNDGGLMGLVPSSVKPIAEVLANESWTGLPIYKDNDFNKDMPEWTKAYSSANAQLVGIAQALNEATGGDRYTKGDIDINPAVVEHLLEGYFGGVASTIDKMVKTVETIAGQREWDPRSVIWVNRMVKNGDERTEYRAVNNEYHRLREEHDNIGRRLRSYENDTYNGIFDFAEKIDFLHNSPEYRRWEIFESYRPGIDALYRLQKETVDERERKEIEAELNELKKAMIKDMDETRK